MKNKLKSTNLEILNDNNLQYIQFPKLNACKTVKHIFSTRHGGVSTGECYSMNLSFNRNDSRENVIENYRRLCSAVGIDIENLVLSQQTHTNNVICVTEKVTVVCNHLHCNTACGYCQRYKEKFGY